MRSRILFGFLFLQLFYACSNEEKPLTSENDADAARNFIRSALDGEYDKARGFMIADSVNNQFLDAFQRNYTDRMSRDDKKGYREASINIHSLRPVNDSTTVVNYSNSYKKQNDSLKVVKTAAGWLVDLKYSFSTQEPISQ